MLKELYIILPSVDNRAAGLGISNAIPIRKPGLWSEKKTVLESRRGVLQHGHLLPQGRNER